jgi:hypothetical protein
MEAEMASKRGKDSPMKGDAPGHRGGDHVRKAQEWGGGSKGSKGPVTQSDKRNPNSSAKS